MASDRALKKIKKTVGEVVGRNEKLKKCSSSKVRKKGAPSLERGRGNQCPSQGIRRIYSKPNQSSASKR